MLTSFLNAAEARARHTAVKLSEFPNGRLPADRSDIERADR